LGEFFFSTQLLTSVRVKSEILLMGEAVSQGINEEAAGAVPHPPVDPKPLLVVEHATKSFGAVRALNDVSIELLRGEAHALLGENGAGKSTLVKILAGVYQPDGGSIYLDGARVQLTSPAAARDAGVSVIYQEPTLFPDLTVAENIFMGRQPLKSGRRIDRSKMMKVANDAFTRLGVHIEASRVARGLSVADQQIVEIAKSISFNAQVIIMDEPTAALTEVEVERLFDVVKTLRSQGAAVMYVSHRLQEVFDICQRVTILRDGAFVKTSLTADTNIDEVIRSMVGRDVVAATSTGGDATGENVLEVERLTREGIFTDISFNVRAGEIVALAGLVGAGRTEVARGIFGIDRVDAGSVKVGGKKLKNASPISAMNAGVGFVPEDRRQQGLVMEMAIDRNVALASLRGLSRFGFVRKASERKLAYDWSTRLSLKYGRLSNTVTTLSGGNQQKVVLAKWLARRPRLLIIDEPTRGIDIGTKAEVHRLLTELVSQGVAVLMISSEMPEVLQISDRILVLCEGRLIDEFSREDANENAIMRAATGFARVTAS
jgi:rhamnose transport system ATP-binding protein